jgi:hypothetical protein
MRAVNLIRRYNTALLVKALRRDTNLSNEEIRNHVTLSVICAYSILFNAHTDELFKVGDVRK